MTLRTQWERPRKGYDQHLRRWVMQEPYLSPHQAALVVDGEDWDPDLFTFTDPLKDPASGPTDTDYFSLRSNHAELFVGVRTGYWPEPNPRNPHRARDGRARRFLGAGGPGRTSDGTGHRSGRRVR